MKEKIAEVPNLLDPLQKKIGVRSNFILSLNVHPMDYLIHIVAMRPDEKDRRLLKYG